LSKRKELNGEKNYPSRLRGRGVDFDVVKSFYIIGKFSSYYIKNEDCKGRDVLAVKGGAQ